ncbi:hypothetical protein KI387_012443, partial [Taxus chinensis]
MRPMTRLQPAASSAGGGLPVCISGIGINPRLQPSNRYPRLPHRHEALRTQPYSRQNSITESEMHHLETALYQRLQEISINEGFARQNFFQEGPRYAVALQMEDLDRRRETIRGMAMLMDERRTVSGERNSSNSN